MGRILSFLVGGDVLIALVAASLGLSLRVRSLPALDGDVMFWSKCLPLFVVVLLSTTHLVELYSVDRIFDKKGIFFRILISLALAFTILSAVHYTYPDLSLGPGAAALVLGAFGLIQFVWHDRYPFLLRTRGVAKKVLILGAGPLAAKIGQTLEGPNHNYVLAGYLQSNREALAVPQGRILGQIEQLFETATREMVDTIVISLSEYRGVLPVDALLQCKFNGIDVVDAMSFHEETTGMLLVNHTSPGWFIFAKGFRVTARMRWAKRFFDLFSAGFGLLLSLPLWPLIALAIKCDSAGPIFFRQIRVGQKGKLFELLKFRTMCRDAEAQTGAVWAQANDARVTRAGRFLRKSRLDEIPQLVNVLRGDMAFVGPRPERPEFVRKLEEKVPYYSRRHAVKPGITGWAQVRFPYGASEEDALEKLKYELYYMKHYSLFFDFLIILETIKVVLFSRGGR